MLKAFHTTHNLLFKKPSKTSRGTLNNKTSNYIIIKKNNIFGIGECNIIPGLSPDNLELFETNLDWLCKNINETPSLINNHLQLFPSIRFGFETAMLDLEKNGEKILFPSNFTSGKESIPINGLIWMDSIDEMFFQIKKKVKEGFSCIKIKVGALNFMDELKLLQLVRKNFPDITIRLDANGAFSSKDVFEKLDLLSKINIHSIEQPVKPGQITLMRELCRKSKIDIALDEELIEIHDFNEKENLIMSIMPKYIILKPSLLGGLKASNDWITIANKHGIGWWITSALESNIGLNAIAQWTYTLKNPYPQGLGTGKLYVNNIDSPLEIKKGTLTYNPLKQWKCNLHENCI